MSNTTTLLNAHQHKLHHLAQFLAAFNSSYLPKASDDSHKSLVWNIEKSALETEVINNIQIRLEYPGLMIFLQHNEKQTAFDPLGAAFGDIESWIRESISSMGMDPGKYNIDLGFTPTSPKDQFVSLDNEDEKILLQLTEERNIAQKALETLKTETGMESSDIRVWPHHFDTGMLLYEDTDRQKGYGLGYTPADEISGHPYFYVYPWPEDGTGLEKLPDPEHGTWHTGNWKGTKIPVDQALDLEMILTFYRDSIRIMKSRY